MKLKIPSRKYVGIAFISLFLLITVSILISFFVIEKRERKKIEIDKDISFVKLDQKYMDGLYDVYERVHNILTKHGIFYSLTGGSILGQIRHGGQMQWDDDGDIIVHIIDKNRVDKLKNELGEHGLNIVHRYLGASRIVLKGYEKNRSNVSVGNQAPFIDILWITQDDNDNNVPIYRYLGKVKKSYPREYYDTNQLKSVGRRPFGHLMLNTMDHDQSEIYLERTYGKSWKTEIRFELPHTKAAQLDNLKPLLREYWRGSRCPRLNIAQKLGDPFTISLLKPALKSSSD